MENKHSAFSIGEEKYNKKNTQFQTEMLVCLGSGWTGKLGSMSGEWEKTKIQAHGVSECVSL